VSPSPTLQTTKSDPSSRHLLLAITAAALILAAAYLVSLLWLRDPGYTLVVAGAPAGSDVYVDNVRRGITAADGTISVPNLERGTRIVRVSREGSADFNDSVKIDPETCKDDRVCILPVTLPTPVVAQPAPMQAPPAPPPIPNEINFNDMGLMVFVPAGEFTMGSEEQDDEKPPHTVSVPAFYVDKFEVTNEQYKKYCDDKKIAYPSDPSWAPGYFQQRPQAPVVGITWEDANAYARWADKRLPNEQEWEKAASWEPGGKKRLWPWGDVAEALGQTGASASPSDVGQHPAGESPYHAHDMAGNVNEWVEAFYRPYPGNKKTDPGCDSSKRVARGCSFPCSIENAKTTRRFCYKPRPGREEGWVLGFRCAVSLDSPKLQEHLRALVR
jgi:formylglycine-generating enzyme required for sulfatase activity